MCSIWLHNGLYNDLCTKLLIMVTLYICMSQRGLSSDLYSWRFYAAPSMQQGDVYELHRKMMFFLPHYAESLCCRHARAAPGSVLIRVLKPQTTRLSLRSLASAPMLLLSGCLCARWAGDAAHEVLLSAEVPSLCLPHPGQPLLTVPGACPWAAFLAQ